MRKSSCYSETGNLATKIKKIFKHLSLTRIQLVLIAGLVIALEIFLNGVMLRIEDTADPFVFTTYFGFPFEAIKVKNKVGSGTYPDVGRIVYNKKTYEFLWNGITMNLLIYIVFSIILVKLTSWIRDEIEYRRYHARA